MKNKIIGALLMLASLWLPAILWELVTFESSIFQAVYATTLSGLYAALFFAGGIKFAGRW